MNLFQRIANWMTGIFGRAEVRPAAPLASNIALAPREAVNDAAAYGVAITPATVTPGGFYWQAVRVHHLTPEENGGNHHVYLDLLDPASATTASPLGGRVYGARARIAWEGGEQIITVDKPLSEPGANFPMWKWQVCLAEALGLSGQELPSDRVTGMHTGHPDEATGNTLFHHSFSITFVKVQAPNVVYNDSVIYGLVHGAAGRNAQLLQGDAVLATQPIAADETFRFADLGAGEYIVGVENTALRSNPVRVTGRDQAQLDLTLIVAESVISGRVLNGAGRVLALTRAANEVAVQTVAADETYRFADLIAGVYQVAIAGTAVISPAVTLTGADAATVDLVAPAAGKALGHYVLFGPREHPSTPAYLHLAQDYLAAFGPSFGFQPEEAKNAGLVTILAGPEAVSAGTEAEIAAGGAPVQRIAGTVSEVAAALAAHIASGKPF